MKFLIKIILHVFSLDFFFLSFQAIMMMITGREVGLKKGSDDGNKNIALFSHVS